MELAFLLELLEKTYQIEMNNKINLFSETFIQLISAKFADTSKIENLDAQIFYLS